MSSSPLTRVARSSPQPSSSSKRAFLFGRLVLDPLETPRPGFSAKPGFFFRGQRTEDRGQRTEDRGQKTEDRRQRTEDRGQGTADSPNPICLLFSVLFSM